MKTRLCQLSQLAAATATFAVVAPVLAQDSTKTPPPAAVSMFTDEQAARGEKVYQNACAECHEKLEYSGADFRVKWNGRSVFELYDLLRTTMPDSKPGALPAQDYIDVVGYMMKLNGVPPGKVELAPTDSLLKAIKIDIPATKSALSVLFTTRHP